MIRAPDSLANSSDAQADRPGADNQDGFVRLGGLPRLMAWQPMASVSTRASCSKLSFVETCSLRAGRVKSGRRPPSQWTPSVWWFSQQLVWPRRAGVALLAVDVRLDGAAVAGLDVGHAVADRHDFDAEFVAGDARIAEERHFAEVAGEIGAADADAMDADDRFAGSGRRRLGDVDYAETLRLLELDGFHECVRPGGRKPWVNLRGGGPIVQAEGVP